ncbi:hypothetical protein BC936DRAFT_147180 [Jimgerdemannia flammicorona]|uniref:DUF4460 domain-containing protein n=1 Tax=Jimgerdemannia flammicorona TaxID=994334 RepID=A0A433D5Y6_9FUNG|nr:hypothetical protein BC936DRAFT_147180 [Jimgerdemannia flammicorona]
MATAKTAPSAVAILRRYWKPFIFQVHPDLFVHRPVEKEINAQSLQHLNTLIDPLCHPELHTSVSRESVPLEVKFFSKTPIVAADGSPPNHTPVTHRFDLPTDAGATVFSFLTLCEKLGIDVLYTDSCVAKELSQCSPRLSKPPHQDARRPPVASPTELFARELRRSAIVTKFSKESCSNTTDKELSLLRSNRLLFFKSGLDRTQRWEAQKNLMIWMKEAREQQWWGNVPVVIASRECGENATAKGDGKENKKGALVIPWDARKEGIARFVVDIATGMQFKEQLE